MKTILPFFCIIIIVLLSNCASTTLIQSTPAGAKVTINGQTIGVTPCTYTDAKLAGCVNNISLEKEGFTSIYTTFRKNENLNGGALVAGLFSFIPLFWVMQYKKTHEYNFIKNVPINTQDSINVPILSLKQQQVERLNQLEKLYNDKIIDKASFDKAKYKIEHE